MDATPAKPVIAQVRGRWLHRYGRRIGLGRVLAFTLLVLMTILRIADPAPVEALRLRVFDAYQVLQPRMATQRPVVIADIDEASLDTLGQWPWPRTRVADLVDRLRQMGAVAIGFDIVFAEPDRLSPGLVADALTGLDPPTQAKLRSLPGNDDILALALRRTRAVLGQTALMTATPHDTTFPQTGFATRGPDATPFVTHFSGLLRNVPVLEAAAAGRGLFTITPERDGIVRRVPMIMTAENALVPSLTLDILRVLTGAGAVLVRTDSNGVLGLNLPGFELPTDAHGQIWVHFAPHDAARFVSVKDILAGQADPARFANKVVLIGTSAIGLLDNKTTPIDRSMPGVEVHAQVLESVLAHAVLFEANNALAIEVCLALLVGIAIIVSAPMVGPFTLLVLGFLVAAALLGVSWYRYVGSGVLLDATYPLTASFLVYLTLTFTNYTREQLGRRQIRSAFGQYLSPALVAQLAQSPEKLVLGGEERVMTILFSDVRGFTTIAELYRHDPQGLTTLMNRFLTPLTNAILAQKGTIDKYMGDAIMAFWNAPLSDADQEVNACTAALDMLDRLAVLNGVRAAEAARDGLAFVPLDVGLGLNTGPCVVGNMGSDLRFDYSVLGDTVNLASRLEGQSKTYGVRIILGDATAKAAANRFAIIEIDRLQVRGKTAPEAISTLLGDDDVRSSSGFQNLSTAHATMLRLYRNREWAAAAEALERSRAAGHTFGLDRLYDVYGTRIEAYRLKPPPDDWTGVYTAGEK